MELGGVGKEPAFSDAVEKSIQYPETPSCLATKYEDTEMNVKLPAPSIALISVLAGAIFVHSANA